MLTFIGYFILLCLAVFVWTLVLLILRFVSKKAHKQFGIIDAASYILLFGACCVLFAKYEPGEETGPALPAPARTSLALSIDSGQTEQPRISTALYTPAAPTAPPATPVPTASATERPVASTAPTAPTAPPATEAPKPAAAATQRPVATAAPTAPTTSPAGPSSSGSGSGGNADNFNTYNNTDQQKTEDTYVLNNNPDAMMIHYPDCQYVAKIAPQNYATTSESLNDLKAKNYSTCGICFNNGSIANDKPAQQPPATEPAKESPSSAASTATNSTMVWVDDTAKRYHKKNGCGMDNAYQVTLEEAVSMGKTPCGRCYK